MQVMKTACTLLCILPLLVACTGDASGPEEVDADETETAQPAAAPSKEAPKKADPTSVVPQRSRAIVN